MYISPPLYKPIKNRLRKYISPGLIVGGLRYIYIDVFFSVYVGIEFLHFFKKFLKQFTGGAKMHEGMLCHLRLHMHAI
jgi:hypothetical protein